MYALKGGEPNYNVMAGKEVRNVPWPTVRCLGLLVPGESG